MSASKSRRRETAVAVDLTSDDDVDDKVAAKDEPQYATSQQSKRKRVKLGPGATSARDDAAADNDDDDDDDDDVEIYVDGDDDNDDDDNDNDDDDDDDEVDDGDDESGNGDDDDDDDDDDDEDNTFVDRRTLRELEGDEEDEVVEKRLDALTKPVARKRSSTVTTAAATTATTSRREKSAASATAAANAAVDEPLGPFGENDFSDLKLKSDHSKRPLWVCSDGHIILERLSPIYQQVRSFDAVSKLDNVLFFFSQFRRRSTGAHTHKHRRATFSLQSRSRRADRSTCTSIN